MKYISIQLLKDIDYLSNIYLEKYEWITFENSSLEILIYAVCHHINNLDKTSLKTHNIYYLLQMLIKITKYSMFDFTGSIMKIKIKDMSRPEIMDYTINYYNYKILSSNISATDPIEIIKFISFYIDEILLKYLKTSDILNIKYYEENINIKYFEENINIKYFEENINNKEYKNFCDFIYEIIELGKIIKKFNFNDFIIRYNIVLRELKTV
jgi:hypothetical protein